MNRIFISYRSSDGKKDANRLCEDLEMVFGEEQVFFDKRDLQAGSSWREVITSALGARPIVLLVLSPDFFGARHGDGRLRLDDADDPVRQELAFALQHDATVVPLRGEGVDMPLAESLPPELRAVTEKHAPRLRTEDWKQDFPRLAEDLIRQGMQPARADWRSLFGGATMPAPTPSTVDMRPWLIVAALAFGVLAVLEAAARHEIEADTWYGAGVLALLPLALLGLVCSRVRQTGPSGRWGGIGMLVLAGLWTLSFFVRGANLPAVPAPAPPPTVAAASSPASAPASTPAPMPVAVSAPAVSTAAPSGVTAGVTATRPARPAQVAPAPAVIVPAPAPPPAVAAAVEPEPASAPARTPSEACRHAGKLDMTCLWRQCNRRPEFAQAPECIKLREEHDKKTNLTN
jgi:hypothetical protein